MRCGACSGSARKLQRALVLSAGGRVRSSRVCNGCARLGWLLVLGADTPDTAATTRRKATRARKVGELARHVLGLDGGKS